MYRQFSYMSTFVSGVWQMPGDRFYAGHVHMPEAPEICGVRPGNLFKRRLHTAEKGKQIILF